MDVLTPDELTYIQRILDGMVTQTRRIIDGASLAVTGDNTNPAELDALREEHGAFFVTMRTFDRTQQLEVLNKQMIQLTADVQRLAHFLSVTAKNRNHAPRDTDALRRLYDSLN
jgi:hypothetical protein